MIYHYTARTPSHLGRILTENVILREGETGRSTTHFPLPCVWFSRRTDFEPTSAKFGRGPGLSATHTRLSLLLAARIGVDAPVAPLTWRNYKLRMRGIPTLSNRLQRGLDLMEQAGRRVGSNPADWFASTKPVGREHWRSVEVHVFGSGWVDLVGDPVPYLARSGAWTEEGIEREAHRLSDHLTVVPITRE